MVDPVAAPPLPRLGRAALKVIAALVLVVVLYLLAGWLGSAIPRNSGWREPARGITILVETNGTHTGIVVPMVTPEKDWRTTFPEAAALHRGEATHLALGWGEREVFLDVPTWGDLSPVAALRIATLGGESVMRVSPYIRPAPSANHRPLRLTSAQYRKLVRRIEATLGPAGPEGLHRSLPGTDPLSLYYPASARYTMLDTCNTWTGDVLGDAGIRIGRWTPLAGGVMKWIESPGV